MKMPRVHPAADKFPLLREDELQQLAEDIQAHGQREPCIMWEGVLLDGRNRWRACSALGVEPKTREFKGDAVAAIDLIVSLNVKRRHMSPVQLAFVAAELIPLYSAAEAKAHRDGSSRGGSAGRSKVDSSLNPPPNKRPRIKAPDGAQKAAKNVGVGRTSVCHAQSANRDAPDVADAVRSGIVTSMSEAQKLAKLDDKSRARIIRAVETGASKTVSVAILELTRADTATKTATEIKKSGEKALIRKQNAIDFIGSLEVGTVDLLLTDPPYSTDVADLETFVRWLRPALALVKDTGRAYVCIGAYPAEIGAYLDEAYEEERMELRQILVWTYRNTLGPSPKNDYKLNWQAILYFVGPDAPPLDSPIMVEQFSVQEINAPDGRQGDRFHAWQKPDELAERFVRHSTKPGDIVVDPFAGTGTFLIAAAKLGRKALGCDTDPNAIEIARSRGCTRAR
jgi:DNA modification methylase